MLTLTIWSLQYTKSEQSNNEEWLIISFFHYYKHRVQVGIFFKFEENGTAGAIRFLVKAINNSIVKIDKPIFISYLYNILANDSRSLVKACELLISHRRSILTTQEDIERIGRQIVYHINNENTLEAVWLLYLRLKLTKKYLKSEITNSITNSNNDLAKIVLLEEYKSRLTKKAKRQMIATANSWILYYQLYYNDYINKDTFSRKSGIKHNHELRIR